MSGPYGPSDPNGQWAQGPGPGGEGDTSGQPGFGAPQPGQQQWAQGQQWGPQPQPGQPQWGPQPGQMGQPSQPQWGQYPGQPQPQWGPQPGQPGAQPWGQPPQKSGKSKLPWVIGAIVAAAVVVAVVVLLLMHFLSGKTLDQSSTQDGVQKIVTESYGAKNVSDVSCPSGQKIERGSSFTCDLQVDGAKKSVTLTFTDDSGTYEVSRPN